MEQERTAFEAKNGNKREVMCVPHVTGLGAATGVAVSRTLFRVSHALNRCEHVMGDDH